MRPVTALAILGSRFLNYDHDTWMATSQVQRLTPLKRAATCVNLNSIPPAALMAI